MSRTEGAPTTPVRHPRGGSGRKRAARSPSPSTLARHALFGPTLASLRPISTAKAAHGPGTGLALRSTVVEVELPLLHRTAKLASFCELCFHMFCDVSLAVCALSSCRNCLHSCVILPKWDDMMTFDDGMMPSVRVIMTTTRWQHTKRARHDDTTTPTTALSPIYMGWRG